MAKNFLFVLCMLIVNSIFSQNIDTIQLEIADPIVIKFKIINQIGEGKCGCVAKNRELCNMYEIEIDSILYVADSFLLVKLLKVTSFVAHDNIKFQIGEIYSASFVYSYYEYWHFQRFINPRSLFLKSQRGYMESIGPCYKFTFLNRMLFVLHINRKKMLESREVLPKEEEYFYILQNFYFDLKDE